MMIDVRGCARCGGDHEGVIFKKFSSPPAGFANAAVCCCNLFMLREA